MQEIAGYDADGKNVLVAKQTGVLRNDEVFTQDDPHFYDGALLALHASPNFVYYTPINGYDPATHTVTFEPLGYDHHPGRAFSIVNNPHSSNAGRICRGAETGARRFAQTARVAPGRKPGQADVRRIRRRLPCDASFVTIQGFWIRKQGWDASTGIEASPAMAAT